MEDKIPPPEMSITRGRYLEAFGRTGARLLRHAEDGDADAAYQLHALLVCENRPMEADRWLLLAHEAGGADRYPGAGDGPSAAKLAFAFGTEYEAAGTPRSALVFYRGAALQRHAEAAYRVGVHHARAGETWEAACWFSRAVLLDHPDARHEYEAMCLQLLAPGLPETVGSGT